MPIGAPLSQLEMLAPPNASRQTSTVDQNRLPPKLTLQRVAILVLIGVIGGVFLGAVTNAVNGAVSPQYFRDVMGWTWRAIPNVWLASIEEGMLEGMAYGFGYALIFVTLTCILSACRCYLGTAGKYSLIAFAITLIFWAIGGACGIAYAYAFPDHCDPCFFGYHASRDSLLCYAWVRGSIWGIVYGGLPAVVITSVTCVHSSQAKPIQYSLRSLFVLTGVTAVFFSLARTLGHVDAVVVLAVIIILVGVVVLPPRVHLATGILLTLVAGTLLWANLRPTGWLYRGWPLSPGLMCMDGWGFDTSGPTPYFALVLDCIVFVAALFVTRAVCELYFRRHITTITETSPKLPQPQVLPGDAAGRRQ
jgi:hypothetical protein